MARPKKTTENTEPTENVEPVVKKTENPDVEKENEKLRNQIDILMKKIESLEKSTVNTSKNNYGGSDLNRRITITSITTGGVNLRTNSDGTAKHFRLERFGQTLPIIYEDLINCVNMDRWIFEEGLVYINDKTAIEDNYLEEYYKKFLKADVIENIMAFDLDTLKNMVSNATKDIQETICIKMSEKINNGDAVDMNKVDIIGKACTPTIDIRDLANKLR